MNVGYMMERVSLKDLWISLPQRPISEPLEHLKINGFRQINFIFVKKQNAEIYEFIKIQNYKHQFYVLLLEMFKG